MLLRMLTLVTLYQMALFFCNRYTSLLRMKSNGLKILKEKYFTLMVPQILVVSQLLFLVQEVVETRNDDQGRILILDIKICDKELLLVNLYNANTQKEQLDTLTKLSEMLNSIPST